MIGDIIFVRTNSPISWIIRKLTRSQWSHVAVIMSDHYLIESDFLKPLRVRKNRYKDFKIIHLNISNEERLSLVSFLLSRTSRRYDYGRIIGIAMYLIGFTKNRNLWNDYNKDICSELIVNGLTILNSPNIPAEVKDAISPADLACILLKEEAVCKR